MLNTIGDRIRFYREQLHMTQEDLAEASNINRVTIARYETGRMEPSSRTLRRLASAMKLSVDDLVNGSDDDTKPINTMEFAVLNKTKDFSDDEWADLNDQADLIIARRSRKQGDVKPT